MIYFLLGGFVTICLVAWLFQKREDDAVSEAWVREQIRERGVRRQA